MRYYSARYTIKKSRTFCPTEGGSNGVYRVFLFERLERVHVSFNVSTRRMPAGAGVGNSHAAAGSGEA